MEIINRHCIVCGSNDYQKLFNITYDYAKNVLNSDPKRKYGWDEKTNSWIVECNKCKCSYVAKVIKGMSLDIGKKKIDSHDFEKQLFNFHKNELFNNIHDIIYNKSILDNLTKILKKKTNINILDYGSGNAEFSIFNDKVKIKSITSYDPLYPDDVNEIFQRLNIKSKACNDISNLNNTEKFDLIICQSVIEHVTYPNQEIKKMKNLLSTDGIIYINNPYMPIKKDLKKLIAAKKITKESRLSCYHIDHINYMMPNSFIQLISKNDLKVVNFWQKFNSSGKSNNLKNLFKININSFLHYITDSFGFYYKKQHFFLKHK